MPVPEAKGARKKKPRGRGKHVPQRTCVVCRTVHDKRELVRLVRTPEGQLVVDKTGKQNGRGAYLCRQRSCWEAALKGRQLARALKMEVGPDEQQVLRSAIEQEFGAPAASERPAMEQELGAPAASERPAMEQEFGASAAGKRTAIEQEFGVPAAGKRTAIEQELDPPAPAAG